MMYILVPVVVWLFLYLLGHNSGKGPYDYKQSGPKEAADCATVGTFFFLIYFAFQQLK
jgi:hypothetical protein